MTNYLFLKFAHGSDKFAQHRKPINDGIDIRLLQKVTGPCQAGARFPCSRRRQAPRALAGST
jgi:hypothetical protein